MVREPTSKSGTTAGAPRGAKIAHLVGGCQQILLKHLQKWIEPVFTETREYYFQCAENADNNETQNQYFEGIRELKAGESAFSDAFTQAMADAMGELPHIKPAVLKSEAEEAKSELSLVEDEELEEGLAISDLTAKLEIKHSQALHALNQRLSVINSGRTIANENSPCSPQAIGEALRIAATKLQMHISLKVALFKNFELELTDGTGGLYEELNEHLVGNGILPNLHYETRRKRQAKGGAPPVRPEGRPAGPASGPRRTGAAPPASHRSASGAATGYSSPAAGYGSAGVTPEQQAAEDQELFDSIRELLAGGRTLAPASPDVSGPAGGYPVPGGGSAGGRGREPAGLQRSAAGAPLQITTDDIQSVLSAMQGAQARGLSDASTIKDLRQQLVSNLRGLGSDGQDIELAGPDADTIDIVDMMFDFIRTEREVRDHAQDLLNKLQIPLLKVALRDKQLFTERNHPAREFLNGLAEAGSVWVEEEDKSSQTFKKMQVMVDRVVSEFEDDVDLFEQLLQDLNKHLTTLRRKSESAERRNIEAMKGREKLTLARDQADSEIGQRVKQFSPPMFVRNLLEQAWSDYLTLSALRHGENSTQWKNGLQLADQLIASTNPKLPSADRMKLRAKREDLHQSVRAALTQVGYKRNDVDVVLANLDECQRWALADEPKIEKAPPVLNKAPEHVSPATDGKGKPKAKPILNKGRFGGVPEKQERVEKLELNDKEKTTLAKLRLTPFGTWFEFVQNQQGDVVRHKLSWFSPVTSRCLFVNHKGVKVEERSLYQLARDMVRGNARIYQPQKKPLFDRAMGKILDRLRGGAPVPA